MKKHIFFLGLMSAATLTLTNCTKEIDQPVSPEKQGYPFEIFASNIDVKTSNEGLTTSWEKNDGLSVFHAENGLTDLGSNDKFVITEENLPANKFTGELTNALEAGKSYDWYVLYPYNARYSKADEGKVGYTTFGSTCSNAVSNAQTQEGNSNMLHICGSKYPVYGSVTDVASSDKVAMEMRHLSSIVKVSVTNNSTAPMIVSEILFSAPQKIVGSFYYGVADGVYTISDENYTSNTAKLEITKGEEIEVGKSADFYMGIVPFSVSNGALTLSVKTTIGTQEKTLNVGAQTVEFKAGKIKTLNFEYNAAPVVVTIPFPWNEDFSETDLSEYIIKSADSETKLWESGSLAGGVAPEILISKGGGYLEANVDMGGKSGNFMLSFLSNYPARISVSSNTENVEIEQSTDTDYVIKVPQGVKVLNLRLENSGSSGNARVDNISLAEGVILSQSLSFEKASCQFYLGSDEANAFTGQDVIGAQTTVTYSSDNASIASVDPSTGKVTLGSVAGTATITATAAASSSYKEAVATYTIELKEKPADGIYTIEFGEAYNSKGVGTYTSSWSVTCNSFTCNMDNWNNNYSNWTYVKAGRKSDPSVATITTANPISEEIKTVAVTIDAITADKINTLGLYMSSSADFEGAKFYDIEKSAREVVITIDSPAKNMYYKIEADCVADGKNNGIIQVSKIVFSSK